MGAVWMWVRSEWRRGWVGVGLVGLLIALAGGVTMVAAAGARRADSAISRFQAFTNDANVLVEPRSTELSDMERLRLLPPAELADRLAGVAGVEGASVIDFVAARPNPNGEWFSAALGAERGQAPTELLVTGREFDADDPYEVMVNENAAEQWGSVGAELTLETLHPTQFAVMAEVKSEAPAGPTIRVRVVGVVRGIEEITDVPEPVIFATPPSSSASEIRWRCSRALRRSPPTPAGSIR